MPRGDGTGPMGMGPMSGRGFGIRNNSFNYGGRGCYGYGFRCSYDLKTQKEVLQEQREILKNRLEAIDGELNNLK